MRYSTMRARPRAASAGIGARHVSDGEADREGRRHRRAVVVDAPGEGHGEIGQEGSIQSQPGCQLFVRDEYPIVRVGAADPEPSWHGGLDAPRSPEIVAWVPQAVDAAGEDLLCVRRILQACRERGGANQQRCSLCCGTATRGVRCSRELCSFKGVKWRAGEPGARTIRS